MTEDKEVYLSINSTQSVRLEKRTITFENIFGQISVQFNFYADIVLFALMIDSVSQFLFTEAKMMILYLFNKF